MIIINGKHQLETPVIVHNVKPQKPWGGVRAYSVDGGKMKSPEPEKKAVIEPKPVEEPKKKTAAESKPIETAALDLKPKKEKPKKRPVHGVETRHRTRR